MQKLNLNAAQTDKEDIGSFFHRFMELLLLTNRRPEDRVYLWIMASETGKQERWCPAPIAGAILTLEKAWKYAAQIEANSRLAVLRRKKKGYP